jgi:hypothetical protein
MSATDSHMITARLVDLQRTVERLSHHVHDLQSQLLKVQTKHRRPALGKPSIWQRLSRSNAASVDRPIRENKRRDNHAVHSV